MADSVSAVLEGSAEELRAWKETLLESCARWLVASFSRQQDSDGTQEQEAQMLLRLNQLLVGVSSVLRVLVKCSRKQKTKVHRRILSQAA